MSVCKHLVVELVVSLALLNKYNQNKYNHVAQALVSFSREKKKACIWLDKCASFLFHFLPTDLA